MPEFSARVVLDSVAPCSRRLTTVVATYPRFIHSEVLTHRDRARNSASSRAIPWPKMREMVQNEPVIPIRFGSEQRGMQTGGEVEDPKLAEKVWLDARDDALRHADALARLGVHKSIVNRLTEPFMWITVVMTATEWKNFFRLRCHPDAEVHFQKIAGMIRDVMAAGEPSPPPRIFRPPCERDVADGGESWHLPFVTGNDLDSLLETFSLEEVKKISVARCARVSYLTHDGVRDPTKDVELFEKLVQGSGFGHFSPHEHVAMALKTEERSGPFVGWRQYRKEFPLENQVG